MFPAPFDYHRAGSVDEVLALLAKYGGDARILAGGQSLIPAMRFRLARPTVLVDINGIGDLSYVRETDGVLAVGALARDAELERMERLASAYPLLADTSAVVADPVVRQSGTVVGSLCHNDPAGDWAVTALAGRASIVVRGANGTRTVAIDDFLVDSFATTVAEGEMAIEVRFPTPPARTWGSYQKIERKVGDFATASAAARVTLAENGTIASSGVAIGAAGPTAQRVKDAELILNGAKPTKELVRAAADAARKLADPAADTRGSVEFKKDMAGVLVGRALTTALERLGVEGLR
ncbi:MAG TPA: xanthine dehydrogenase family protein subunit M [Candidatus Elarobacter sp.]|nr:xanthine dehydrogenase family protein subunit M [Candidatus Elarobacter sp.]